MGPDRQPVSRQGLRGPGKQGMRTAWPPGPAAVRQSRLHELFFGLAQRAGAKDTKALAHQLVLLCDGAGVSAWPDRDPSAETAAGTVAAALVDAAIPD